MRFPILYTQAVIDTKNRRKVNNINTSNKNLQNLQKTCNKLWYLLINVPRRKTGSESYLATSRDVNVFQLETSSVGGN